MFTFNKADLNNGQIVIADLVLNSILNNFKNKDFDLKNLSIVAQKAIAFNIESSIRQAVKIREQNIDCIVPGSAQAIIISQILAQTLGKKYSQLFELGQKKLIPKDTVIKNTNIVIVDTIDHFELQEYQNFARQIGVNLVGVEKVLSKIKTDPINSDYNQTYTNTVLISGQIFNYYKENQLLSGFDYNLLMKVLS